MVALAAFALLFVLPAAGAAVEDAFPRIDLRVGELLILGVTLVAGSVTYQLRRGRRYALLNVYSGIFFSEFIVGTLVATTSGEVANKRHLATESVVTALGLGVAGYCVLLCGYYLPSLSSWWRARGEARARESFAAHSFPPAYRVALFATLAVTLALGFVQLALRVQKAGGFANYLAIAYTLRYGTYADSDVSNAWAVLASLLAAGALPAAALLYVAWMRRQLTGLEKWLLIGLTVLLIAHQASTAFRAVVVFTLISAFAVYDAERRIGLRKLVVGVTLIAAALVGVNYVHVMLHTLTGVGKVTTFSEASEELMAPHAYLETLSGLVDARDRLEPLRGQGMLTSILYFVPRAIWTAKVPSEEYGTGLVQQWAGLTTTYQMAVTNVGELFVHFGVWGLAALLVWGLIYRWLDDKWEAGLEWRVVLLCIAVPRVFPDQGMGLSAFMISITSLAGFLVPLAVAKRLLGLRAHVPGP